MSKRQGWPTSRPNSVQLCLRHRLSLQGLSGQLQLWALSRCLIVQEQEEISVVHQKGAVDAPIPVPYLVIEAGPTVCNSKPRRIQAKDSFLVSSRDSGTLQQPLSVPEPDFLDGETPPSRRLITYQL